MNTPAHLIIGMAVCARPASSRLLVAAAIGAALPDLSLYVLAGMSLFVLGIEPERVFNELYFSAEWQTVFAIDNSFLVWVALFAICAWRQWRFGQVLCLAALLHIALDFPLHHDDGRPHFWPLSDWVFESPLSYWDRDHGARFLAPIEACLASVCLVLVWRRHPPLWTKGLMVMLIAMEFWIVGQWLFFFQDSVGP